MYTSSKKLRILPDHISLFLCCIVWLMGLLLLGGHDATFNGWMLIALYIFGSIFLFKVNGGRPYPFVIFMLYCFVSNAGQTLVRLLGLQTETSADIYLLYSSKLIGRMLLLQGAIVLCMIVGYTLLRKKQNVNLTHGEANIDTRQELVINWEDILLWGVALVVAYTYAQELSQRVILSYGEYFYETRQGLGTVMQYIYHVVMFAYLMRHDGWKKKSAYCIAAILAVMSIFIGSRSATIPMLVGCAFIFMLTQTKEIKHKFRYFLFAVMILIVFSAFTELRDYAISELSFALIFKTLALSPLRALVNILQEMGTSARTTLTTMKALDFGVVKHESTIMYSLLKGVFPIQVLDLFGISAPSIPSLSAWVSEYGSGLYVLGQGWGYSIIAEAIYNFGNWSFVFGFVFGIIFAALENLIEKLIKNRSYYMASAILYVLGYGVFLARAETTLLATRIRYTVYFSILILLFRTIQNRGRLKIR